MTLDDYDPSTRTKVLIYGPPKSGKTALVGKLASHYTLHWFDLENGIKTLRQPAILDPQFRKNIKVFNIPDHRLYPIAIDTIRDVMRGGVKKICDSHGKVNCPLCTGKAGAKVSEIDILSFTDNDILVIDSGSQLGASALNKCIIKELMKPDGQDYKCTFHDYATQGALMEQVLSLVQVININIVIISHEVDIEKSETKEKIVPRLGTRNFSGMVGKYFDECIYLSILNKKHHAYSSTTYSPTVLTGGRSGVILDSQAEDKLSLLPIFQRPAIQPAKP